MDSQYTQSNTPSFRSPVVDEERIRPNHWLCSVLWHWLLDDRKDIQSIEKLVPLTLQASLLEKVKRETEEGTS